MDALTQAFQTWKTRNHPDDVDPTSRIDEFLEAQGYGFVTRHHLGNQILTQVIKDQT